MSEFPRKVTPGERFGFPAAFYNKLVDGLKRIERLERLQRAGGAWDKSQTLIRVRNETGSDLDRYSVVQPSGFLFNPGLGDQLDDFKNKPTITVKVPSGRFNVDNVCITQEPIKNGELGLACVSGLSPVKVDITTQNEGSRFAEAKSGETGFLRQQKFGPCRIIHRETGSGQVWAYVRIGVQTELAACAKTDADGLTAMSGDTPGIGNATIYTINSGTGELQSINVTVVCRNIALDAIPGNTYILMEVDLEGAWWCVAVQC